MTDAQPVETETRSQMNPARRVVLAVLSWGVIALLSLWLAEPPSALGLATGPEQVSGARAFDVLERLARGGVDAGQVSPPRTVGSEANARCRERIMDELRRLGLRPEVQEVHAAAEKFSCAGIVRNVVCRLSGARTYVEPGGTGAGQAILCMAHYDSVGAGPGIGDDLAGVAALIEAARALQQGGALNRDVIFLFEDAEEVGLLGAEVFAAQHPWAAEVGAVVNIEGRGTTGPSMLFELGSGNEWLIRAFKEHASAPSSTSVSAEIYKRMPNDTDYTVWRERGVPGLNFAFIGGVNRYHTPLDDLANLSLDSLQHHASNAIEAIRALDACPSFAQAAEGKPDAVFFDILGRHLVLYKVRTARILGMLLFLGALFAAARSIRVGAARPVRILLSFFLVLLVLTIGFYGARGENWLYQLMGAGVGVSQPAHLGPVLIGLVAAAAVGVGLGGFLVGGPCRASEVGSAVTVLFAGAAAACAWVAPGASFLFAIPALVLCIGGLGLRTRSDVEARWARTGIVALCVSAVLVLTPIHAGLIQAFGVTLPGVAIVPVLLGALLLMPSLVGPGRKASLWLAGFSFIAAGFTAVFVGQLATHSVVEPGHLNLVHVEGDGNPRWHIMGVGDAVDPGLLSEMRGALPPGSQSTAPVDDQRWVPWSWRPLTSFPAPAVGDPAPTVQVLSQELLEDGETIVHLKLLPGRPCDQLLVSLAGARSPVVDGVTLGDGMIRFLAPSEDGEFLSFRSERTGGVGITLWSKQFGLRGVRGTAADAYYDVRPAEFVPFQDGDGSLVRSSHRLVDLVQPTTVR